MRQQHFTSYKLPTHVNHNSILFFRLNDYTLEVLYMIWKNFSMKGEAGWRKNLYRAQNWQNGRNTMTELLFLLLIVL
jgi:hypothetical protein